MRMKADHNGAKNGGGHWGKREEAKRLSKRKRRQDDAEAVADYEPCSWCSGDGFVGVTPCRDCKSTGVANHER